MGPCTASSCCCQAPNLPWAPVPPPHAAARPLICHGPLYRLLMLLPGPQSLMGPCTASPCATFRSPHTAGVFHFFVIGCWQITGLPLLLSQAPNLPWAPVPTSSCCCQFHRVSSWVPVRPPIAAVSIATTLPSVCHFQFSSPGF
ncbi:unnamed protein product, partial [Staurois parvus]